MTGTCGPFKMFSFSVTMHIEFLSSFRLIKVVRIRILVEEEGGSESTWEFVTMLTN